MQLPKFIKKKECYRLSWFSYLILFLLIILIVDFYRNNIYKYLSPIKPIKANVLVIEGWIEDYGLKKAIQIINDSNYDLIITTGGPLELGYLATHFVTNAELAKRTLIELGVDSTRIQAVPSQFALTDRTLNSALTLKIWLEKNHPDIEKFNLISLGTHSRRSWYLFEKAMPEKEIGIIALRDIRFEHEKWWKSSKGARTVITETIGYYYVYLFM